MACGGILSPVGLIAGAGLLQNTALGINTNLVSNLGSFNNLPITSQFSSIVTSATGTLGSSTLDSLRTLGADSFPALTNAIPGNFSSVLSAVAPGGVVNGGFTGLISGTASSIMGGGDLSKFSQVFGAANGYTSLANQFINSNLNVGNLATTFGPITGGMDNLITGSFSQVSQAFGALGGDMSNLGNLIDMNNLANLGDPSALVRQLSNVGGLVPGVEAALRTAGVDSLQLANLATGSFPGLSDSANKLLYEGMTKITGDDLAQVKSILGVTTPNIGNMADLLDPAKILPTSFTTLTMPTPDGLRGIYVNSSGAVNANLEKYLIDPNAPQYTGDDPIIRARLGLDPIGGTGTVLI